MYIFLYCKEGLSPGTIQDGDNINEEVSVTNKVVVMMNKGNSRRNVRDMRLRLLRYWQEDKLK